MARHHILSRADWRAAYRQLRLDARDNFKRGKAVTLLPLIHGGTYWTVCRDSSPYVESRVYPTVIVDRSPTSRAAHELAWAAKYRRAIKSSLAFYGAQGRVREIAAARACVADARSIRLSASAFHGVAS